MRLSVGRPCVLLLGRGIRGKLSSQTLVPWCQMLCAVCCPGTVSCALLVLLAVSNLLCDAHGPCQFVACLMHQEVALSSPSELSFVLIAYFPFIWSWATLLKAWPKAPKCAPTSKCVPKLFFSPFLCFFASFSSYFLQDL